ERFLADARALALAELVGEARAGALLQTQDFQAQQMRLGDVQQRLARILVRMKHAAAAGDLCRLNIADRRELDRAPLLGESDRHALRGGLQAPVAQGLL